MFINQRYTRNKMYHINYTLTLQIKLSDKEKKIFQNQFSRRSLKYPWLIQIKQLNHKKIVLLMNIDN